LFDAAHEALLGPLLPFVLELFVLLVVPLLFVASPDFAAPPAPLVPALLAEPLAVLDAASLLEAFDVALAAAGEVDESLDAAFFCASR
jgi:hypothetical protein